MPNKTSIEFRVVGDMVSMIYKSSKTKSVLTSEIISGNESFNDVISKILNKVNIENIRI